jgi:TIR domain
MSDNLSIFISYARAESAFVDKLEAEIKLYGFTVWVDRSKLHAGQEWIDKIENAINECDVLIVVISPQSINSKYVKMEYRYASKNGKKIIPLLSTSCPQIPIDLTNLQQIDFQNTFDVGMKELLNTLRHIAGTDHNINTFSHNSDRMEDLPLRPYSGRKGGLPLRPYSDRMEDLPLRQKNSLTRYNSLPHLSTQTYQISAIDFLDDFKEKISIIRPEHVKIVLSCIILLMVLPGFIGLITLIVSGVLAFLGRSPVDWVWGWSVLAFIWGCLGGYLYEESQIIIENFGEWFGYAAILVLWSGLIGLIVCIVLICEGQPPLWWVWLACIVAIPGGWVMGILVKSYDASEVQ